MRIKAKKLMQKNYNLVNTVTGETLVIHPPSMPGADADGKNPKKDGKWIRRFNIVDGNGVAAFAGQSTIVLTHAPKVYPVLEQNGQTWEVRAIEEVEAPAVTATV